MGLYTISKFENANSSGNRYYTNEQSIGNIIRYIFRADRWNDEICITYAGVRNINIREGRPRDIIRGIKKWQEYTGKASGRRMYHYILSFPEKIEPQLVDKIAREIMDKFFTNMQVVYAVHEDTVNIHVHFALGAVMMDGRKINFRKKEYFEMKMRIERYADNMIYQDDPPLSFMYRQTSLESLLIC